MSISGYSLNAGLYLRKLCTILFVYKSTGVARIQKKYVEKLCWEIELLQSELRTASKQKSNTVATTGEELKERDDMHGRNSNSDH